MTGKQVRFIKGSLIVIQFKYNLFFDILKVDWFNNKSSDHWLLRSTLKSLAFPSPNVTAKIDNRTIKTKSNIRSERFFRYY